MPPTQFSMDIHVGDDGIVRVRMIGAMNADAFIEKYDDMLKGELAGVDVRDRPVLVDARGLATPEKDWLGHFKTIIAHFPVREERPCRRAVVIGNDKELQMLMGLFREFETAVRTDAPETRTFESYDDAHAWVADGWTPPEK